MYERGREGVCVGARETQYRDRDILTDRRPDASRTYRQIVCVCERMRDRRGREREEQETSTLRNTHTEKSEVRPKGISYNEIQAL